MKSYKNINEYIKQYPKEVQGILKKMRATIKSAAPQATEAIKYGIPTFVLNGNLVHFGGFKNHVSFFPTSSPVSVFKKDLSKYKVSKGTIRFPINKPIPYGLIKKIVRFRVRQNLEK